MSDTGAPVRCGLEAEGDIDQGIRHPKVVQRRVIRVTATVISIGIGAFILFLALSYASLGRDRNALADQVRSAFAANDLAPNRGWAFGDTDIGAHQHNDCLILYQALDDRAPRHERAVSPTTTAVGTIDACGRLQALAVGDAIDPPRFYHQYLHAHTTLARLLVPELGVRGVRGLYKLLVSIVLLAGIAYSAIALTRNRRVDTNALWLVLFLIFARWYGLEAFGQSLGHGPADTVLLCFLLFISRASAGRPLAPRTAIVSAAVFGALTIQFEFLTGGLPLGLALIIGALPLALSDDGRNLSTVVDSACAFVGAAATCLGAKLVIVVAVFGFGPVLEIGQQLLFRTGLDDAVDRQAQIGPGAFFGRVWAGLDALAPGMHWLAAGMLVLSVCAALWSYRVLRASAHARDRELAIALLGSNLVPLIWMLALWQHTAEHAWFMDRLFVWPVASGAALFVLALRRRSPQPQN